MLKVVSWNVRHFKGAAIRFDRVVGFLRSQTPDVFAIYEVTGGSVYRLLRDEMPTYSFSITEGTESQEIIVGARSGLDPAFTQRPDLRSGVDNLRPGALVTVLAPPNDEEYSFLFLHTKSGNDPRSLGLRDDMVKKAFKLNGALQKAAGAANRDPANYVFCGDLNTMGMEYTHLRSQDIDAGEELEKLDRFAIRRDMRLLPKSHTNTWSGGTGSSIPDSDLDQVVASGHLQLTSFTDGPVSPADVRVKGWVDESTAAGKDKWISDHSDHSLLYFEVNT